MLDKLKAYGFQALALVLAVLLLMQTWRLHSEQLDHQKLITTVADAGRVRATANLKAEQRNSGLTYAHAKQTQENSDEFTTSQPVRDALARADVATADRLRRDAERRAATYKAMSKASAAACSDLADRHAVLDDHIVRGARLVAGLRETIAERDAQIILTCKQIAIERRLSASFDPPCGILPAE